ncbi:sugar ABC transporter substrate-binding protein [Streptomyces sp. CB02923]|uniref:extracellular solute-binding protein n=1 Tax=Streptomyces sp. CB02923 TaxID=1718985 RepID=UPI00093E2FE0|nr:extracellular solute-binding protein [Streptomyces sp. CB02923]OKI09258.1 sugar ABC transporter substrate-binding protein [Streptomyces sp. CB02923]
MRRTAPMALLTAAVLAAGTLTACGGPGGDKNTLKVAFPKDTNNKVTLRDDYVEMVTRAFEKANPGKKVELIPIQASENDYYAKIQQMMRSPKTAPDLVYEDTFLINSDITAGLLRPLDPYIAKWADWKQFEPSAKAAARAQDGRTYGVPDGTDTRGLWFNRKIFKKAGLPQDWRPKTWDEVLDAARTVKREVPGVIPLNVYTGKGAGEAAVMQGFEMLLYGTGKDQLYDPAAKKWVTGSKGFRDSLEFLRTVYGEKLGPDLSDALSPNIQTNVATELMPEEKLAINLDGSWLGQQWQPKGGGKPWPEWPRTLGRAAFPTQTGAAPGRVSLAGGWTWSVPRQSQRPDLAWKLIETFQTQRNALEWCVRGAQIAVRKDVAADPAYLKSVPGIGFFTALVKVSRYRPALPVYPKVSAAIGEAMEAVTSGAATPAKAAADYDEQLKTLTDGQVVAKP